MLRKTRLHGFRLADFPGGAFHSFFESKFKAPKTPPSHGLTGLAAIESIAKSAPDSKDAGNRKKRTLRGGFETGLPPEKAGRLTA